VSIGGTDLTVGFSNIPSGSSKWTTELQYDFEVATYDIANASYDNVSFSVSAQETSPQGMFFKPDGTKMYIIGTSGADVNEYDLSVAWDITSAVYLQLFSVNAQEGGPTNLAFKPDGTKMYVIGLSGDAVNEYDLSVAWDVTSAVYLQNFSINAQESAARSVFFKPDGNKMYVVGSSGDTVYQYSIGSLYDTLITWPTSIIWENLIPPAIPILSQTIIVEFYTSDSGTTIYGIKKYK
jgi:sugar lactone lactonase YvrE